MLTFAVLLWSLLTFLTPIFGSSIKILIMSRIALGMAEGVGTTRLFPRSEVRHNNLQMFKLPRFARSCTNIFHMRIARWTIQSIRLFSCIWLGWPDHCCCGRLKFFFSDWLPIVLIYFCCVKDLSLSLLALDVSAVRMYWFCVDTRMVNLLQRNQTDRRRWIYHRTAKGQDHYIDYIAKMPVGQLGLISFPNSKERSQPKLARLFSKPSAFIHIRSTFFHELDELYNYGLAAYISVQKLGRECNGPIAHSRALHHEFPIFDSCV